MKHYISEEEKKKQIEQMWEEYEKNNRASNSKLAQSEYSPDFRNEINIYFDEDAEISSDEPTRYEKYTDGKPPRQKFKKKTGQGPRKSTDSSFD